MSNLKIALINPPSPKGVSVTRDSMGGFGSLAFGSEPGHPPMSLLYSATVLEKNGESIEIIDCVQKDKQRIDFFEAVDKTKDFDIIAVLIAMPSYLDDLNFVKTIKNNSPSKVTIILGPIVSFFVADAMGRSGSDFAITGEPEYILSQLIKAIENKTELDQIEGLARIQKGKVVINKAGSKIDSLDALPYPAWHLLNQKDIRFSISASRGCPHDCCYCPYSAIQGKVVRYRSAESVVKEIIYLQKRFHIKQFLMRDPIFTLDKRRVERICSLIQEKGLKISFTVETRPEHLDRDLVNQLKQAGCNLINLGVESGNPQILVNADRFKSLAKAKETLEYTLEIRKEIKKHKISLTAFFVVGLPGDNLSSLEETIGYAKRLDADFTQFSLITPFPGTKLFKEESQGFKLPEDFAKMNSFITSPMGTEYLSPQELEDIKKRADFEIGIQSLRRRPFKIIPIVLKSGKRLSYLRQFISGIFGFTKEINPKANKQN